MGPRGPAGPRSEYRGMRGRIGPAGSRGPYTAVVSLDGTTLGVGIGLNLAEKDVSFITLEGYYTTISLRGHVLAGTPYIYWESPNCVGQAYMATQRRFTTSDYPPGAVFRKGYPYKLGSVAHGDHDSGEMFYVPLNAEEMSDTVVLYEGEISMGQCTTPPQHLRGTEVSTRYPVNLNNPTVTGVPSEDDMLEDGPYMSEIVIED